jgi:threonine dehydrogenase-like Zn-dependent dehydrogenase
LSKKRGREAKPYNRAMRALWLENRSLSVRDDVVEPDDTQGEAVVRVVRSGICNTDLELVRGYYPFTGVPGHEFVGVVEDAPDRTWIGRRVVGEINATCGTCRACWAGRKSHCEARTVLGIVARNGAHAQFLGLPLANLHGVPDTVSDDEAVFAEPLAAALEIQDQVPLDTGHSVLVIGDGKLGQLIAQTLKLTGCELRVVGRHQEKRDLLEARGIATMSGREVRRAAYDVVVDCTGKPDGLKLARAAVRPRGTIVLKSTYAGDTRLDLSSIVVDEITLIGSRCGPFAPALDLLARRLVDVRPLIHARYPLREAVEAFDHAAQPGLLKILLEPEY